jgi:site-specific DNA-cytosine methylase
MAAPVLVAREEVLRVGFLAGGIGGVALGFKWAKGTYMMGDTPVNYRYEIVGSIDVNPDRNREFERLVGAPAHTVDLFTRRDYIAFHSEFKDLPEDQPILPDLLTKLARKTKDRDGLVEVEGRRYWRYEGTWAEVVRWAPPPEGWEEVTPADLRRIFGEKIDVMFSSTPCQGNSRLLSEDKAATWKYVALNNLTARVFYLITMAWPEDPPIALNENVPGIKHRSKAQLEDMARTAAKMRYRTHSGDHDAGRKGGLAQSRPRHFWAQVPDWKIPQFLYNAPDRPLKAIMDVLGDKPMPGDPAGGPMHKLPNTDFLTNLRLALIKPGGDWRDIPGPGEWELLTLDGRVIPTEAICTKVTNSKGEEKLKWRAPDPDIWGKIFVAQLLPTATNYPSVQLQHVPMGNGRGAYWVQDPGAASGTVTADPSHRKSGGASTVADNRIGLDVRCPEKEDRHASHLRNTAPNSAAGAITGATHLANGAPSTADPRFAYRPNRHHVQFHVQKLTEEANTITTQTDVQTGAPLGSDLRLAWRDGRHATKYEAFDPNKPSDVITTSDRLGSGAPSLADPRFGYSPRNGAHGVLPPDEPASAIPGYAAVNSSNTPSAAADPRMTCASRNGTVGVIEWAGRSPAVIASLDIYAGTAAVEDRRVNIHWWPEWFPEYLIISPWNAWHRPLTDWELWLLQGCPAYMEDGSAWYIEGTRKDRRQAIGNMIPPPASEAYGHALAPTLIVARLAPDAFLMDHMGAGIWVIPETDEPAQLPA